MKRSRLNLFKATSMSISVLGIILIVATLVLFAYLGINAVTQSISTNVGSGSGYDQLNILKQDYNLYLDENENSLLVNYIFDKIINDGKPFSF